MKRIYTIVMIVLVAMSAQAAAGELADWYLYVWSDAANAGGDRGQFKTTDTDGVFVLQGFTVTEDDAAGVKFCMHSNDWSAMYGWSDEGGSLDATDKEVKLATATSATGWMSLPAGKYDVTWNATALTIMVKASTATTEEAPIPTELKIYDKEGTSVLATLAAVDGKEGVFAGQMNVTEPWQVFSVVDEENSIWYGTDPSNKTSVSSAEGCYKFWIDGETLGVYDIEVDLKAMSWTHSYNDTATGITIVYQERPDAEFYNIAGQRVTPGAKGLVIHNGKTYYIK